MLRLVLGAAMSIAVAFGVDLKSTFYEKPAADMVELSRREEGMRRMTDVWLGMAQSSAWMQHAQMESLITYRDYVTVPHRMHVSAWHHAADQEDKAVMADTVVQAHTASPVVDTPYAVRTVQTTQQHAVHPQPRALEESPKLHPGPAMDRRPPAPASTKSPAQSKAQYLEAYGPSLLKVFGMTPPANDAIGDSTTGAVSDDTIRILEDEEGDRKEANTNTGPVSDVSDDMIGALEDGEDGEEDGTTTGSATLDGTIEMLQEDEDDEDENKAQKQPHGRAKYHRSMYPGLKEPQTYDRNTYPGFLPGMKSVKASSSPGPYGAIAYSPGLGGSWGEGQVGMRGYTNPMLGPRAKAWRARGGQAPIRKHVATAAKQTTTAAADAVLEGLPMHF